MRSVKFFSSNEFGYPGRNADCNINGSLLPPLPSSSSIPSLPTDSHRSTFPGTLVVMVALFSTAFLLVSCSVTLFRCFRRRNSTGTLHQQNLPNSDDFFLNQDTINHVWYINTVGLDESLINSLTILKFKSGEGLVEGTYCSVCLSEFQDGEELRLLPKCNHAFHIQCIDRWLRGHVSCPLCRAPIVANSVAGVDPLPVDDNGALLSDTIESNVTSELSIHDEDNNLESSVDELYELDIEHGKRNRAFDASCANFRESKSELQDKAVPEESSAEFHVRRPVSRSFLIRERVCKGSESDPECDFFPVQRGSTLCSGSSYSEKANLDELPWFNGVSVDSGHNSCELKVVGDARKELYVHKKRSSEMKRSLSMSGDTSSFFFPKHRRNKSSILPL